MLIKTARMLLASAALALPLSALASTPVGIWKTIDDATGEAKSLVTIREENGQLTGAVTKILNEAKRDAVCEKCDDARKGQKVEGMTILWGMEKDGDKYDDGKILDPESGKIYSANMKLLDKGEKLEVRGYIGFSLIGRSQVWERVDKI
ncbi:DUF2147 domain-containing protein [Endozoicomonas sp. Mp262]|uniref:DUF2147 domain-containing protein n=1 Tax=Endozoicomonas sp. Mp262 TaxID=2919499 RepID=UPI0021D9AC4B